MQLLEIITAYLNCDPLRHTMSLEHFKKASNDQTGRPAIAETLGRTYKPCDVRPLEYSYEPSFAAPWGTLKLYSHSLLDIVAAKSKWTPTGIYTKKTSTSSN
jgi:hypothetical protein